MALGLGVLHSVCSFGLKAPSGRELRTTCSGPQQHLSLIPPWEHCALATFKLPCRFPLAHSCHFQFTLATSSCIHKSFQKICSAGRRIHVHFTGCCNSLLHMVSTVHFPASHHLHTTSRAFQNTFQSLIKFVRFATRAEAGSEDRLS